MKNLHLEALGSKSVEEPSNQDKRLINALLQSGMNQLTDLTLKASEPWFSHDESN